MKENVQNVLFFSYKVFPIASSEGLIKVVQANTVSKILNDHKSVLNYLNTLAQNAEDIKKYKDNYFKSCGKTKFIFMNFYLINLIHNSIQ